MEDLSYSVAEPGVRAGAAQAALSKARACPSRRSFWSTYWQVLLRIDRSSPDKAELERKTMRLNAEKAKTTSAPRLRIVAAGVIGAAVAGTALIGRASCRERVYGLV